MQGVTTRVRKLLGAGRGPTSKGWWNFCHKRCGDHRFRLGVHFRQHRFRCFNCGASGGLDVLLPDLGKGPLAAPLDATPRRSLPVAPLGLPWRPLPAQGPLSPLAEGAVAYLASRGIPRGHAVRLGLGYGVEGRWVGRVIHPYYDDRGSLAGWQGRLTGDPDELDEAKTKFPRAADMPRGLTRLLPKDGALYMIDRLPLESPVMVNEGPYDAAHAERVLPAVALFGSVMFEAQMRRLLSRRPSAIYLALDPDKSGPWWNEVERRWMPDPRPPILSALYRRTDAPIYYVPYPALWEGDVGGRPDQSPHSTEELTALIEGAVRFRPGATLR